MDEARRLAVADAAEGAVVQADTQGAGRGRFGNSWVSEPGNLYMTLLLRPKAPSRRCAQISFLIAVALADTLQSFGVPSASINLKWPNDVLLDGKKVAGILLEMETAAGNGAPPFLLVGIGVNIAHAPEGAIALASFDARADTSAVRKALVETIAGLYGIWQKQGFVPIRTAWMRHVYGLGRPITARMSNASVSGVFEDVDDEGNLRMRDASGTLRTITGAAVHFDPH